MDETELKKSAGGPIFSFTAPPFAIYKTLVFTIRERELHETCSSVDSHPPLGREHARSESMEYFKEQLELPAGENVASGSSWRSGRRESSTSAARGS